MAGAYLGVGEPDVVIDVGVSGPGVVKKALDRAFKAKGEFLTITDAAEVIKHTAYKVTRVGEIIGNEVANRLNLPFGVADLSLAPTPAVGDSVGEIFQSLGLSSIGAPGTTAILFLPLRTWAGFPAPSFRCPKTVPLKPLLARAP